MELDGAADLTPAAEPQLQLLVPPEQFPGHWANYATAARTPHELTIDFYRVGPGGQQAMVVSRINCSPLLLRELLDALQEQWDAYQESQPE
jgi:hypothetical protein